MKIRFWQTQPIFYSYYLSEINKNIQPPVKKISAIKCILKRRLVVTTIISHIYLLCLHTHPLENTSLYLLNHLMHWLQLCLLLHSSKLQKFHLFPYSCELEHLSKKMKNTFLKMRTYIIINPNYWGKNTIMALFQAIR